MFDRRKILEVTHAVMLVPSSWSKFPISELATKSFGGPSDSAESLQRGPRGWLWRICPAIRQHQVMPESWLRFLTKTWPFYPSFLRKQALLIMPETCLNFFTKPRPFYPVLGETSTLFQPTIPKLMFHKTFWSLHNKFKSHDLLTHNAE
jgi:hypothetical protein